MSDFNIDLLKSEACDFSHNFLLSMQSYSFSPVIDKSTRVHNNAAIYLLTIFLLTELALNSPVATLSQT